VSYEAQRYAVKLSKFLDNDMISVYRVRSQNNTAAEKTKF